MTDQQPGKQVTESLDRIFVLDDELKNRELLGDILEIKGYEVERVEDGQKTLGLVVEKTPDVILLDLMMPCMDDGFEVCRRLKESPETVP